VSHAWVGCTLSVDTQRHQAGVGGRPDVPIAATVLRRGVPLRREDRQALVWSSARRSWREPCAPHISATNAKKRSVFRAPQYRAEVGANLTCQSSGRRPCCPPPHAQHQRRSRPEAGSLVLISSASCFSSRSRFMREFSSAAATSSSRISDALLPRMLWVWPSHGPPGRRLNRRTAPKRGALASVFRRRTHDCHLLVRPAPLAPQRVRCSRSRARARPGSVSIATPRDSRPRSGPPRGGRRARWARSHAT
jgi:hypothetical protein